MGRMGLTNWHDQGKLKVKVPIPGLEPVLHQPLLGLTPSMHTLTLCIHALRETQKLLRPVKAVRAEALPLPS